MNKIKEFLGGDKIKAVIAVVAAVVMYFTPDNVDKIIETVLGLFAIDCLVLKKKDNNEMNKNEGDTK